jgi:hypothetical protein
MVNGKEVLKKGFRTEAEKASLNKNKFVTI